MKTTSSRIGSIDLLKFLLAICIVILHSGQTYGGDSYHLNMGGIAVEMFFIISGCLMCRSAEKTAQSSSCLPPLSTETLSFIGRKIKEILLPYCILLITFLTCWYITTGEQLIAEEGIKAFLLQLLLYLPNFLLVYMAGIAQDHVLTNIIWYISAMLIVMLITYPLIRRFKSTYTQIVAPSISLLLMGFMYNTSNGYKGITNFLIIMPQGLMRAFIAINLGCVAWEMARWLKQKPLTRLSRILLSAAALLICMITWFVMEYGSGKGHLYSLVLLFPFLAAILFSEQMAGSAIFNNCICTYLGNASMYMYLYHIAVRRILITAEVPLTYLQATAILLLSSFGLYVITDLLMRLWKKYVSTRGIRISALFFLQDP